MTVPPKMESYEIVLTFDPDATEVDAKISGVPGPQCAAHMDWLKQLGDVIVDESTPEFYQAAKAAQGVKVK